MSGELRPVKCPVSKHTLIHASGSGTTIRIHCRCKRWVLISATGIATIDENQESETAEFTLR